MKPVAENVVIAGNQLNPGAFSQVMLVKKGLATEEDVGVFTPGYVQIATHEYELMVLPDRLHFGLSLAADRQKVVREKLGVLVETLPYTPYTSIGINFLWQSGPLGPSIASVLRQRFIREGHPLTGDFQDGDPRFGIYFSRSVFGTRLRLSILPTLGESPETELVQAAFNYNVELRQGEAVEQIVALLVRWAEFQRYSESLAKKLQLAP